MKFFMKELLQNGQSDLGHEYFVRFGKGTYPRRFLVSLQNSKKIKVKGSSELANAFVDFVEENFDANFSGKILTKEKVSGKEGKKKAGSFVYEISNSKIDSFAEVYFKLLDASSEEFTLKIKKALPKPGKNAEKIDDKFCSLELDPKHFAKIKDVFFWDIPENVKKVKIEHELVIEDIVPPKDEDDPAKIRELAKRKGKIIRKVDIDGKETSKEFNFEC